MKEFVTALRDAQAEDSNEEEFVEFKLDDRVMRAYVPTDGQMTFMVASMGRGQTGISRTGALLNIILSCLRMEDRDYLEARLLSREPSDRISDETLEDMVSFLLEEWFGRPTRSASDSSGSAQNDSPKSTPPTTNSQGVLFDNDPLDSST